MSAFFICCSLPAWTFYDCRALVNYASGFSQTEWGAELPSLFGESQFQAKLDSLRASLSSDRLADNLTPWEEVRSLSPLCSFLLDLSLWSITTTLLAFVPLILVLFCLFVGRQLGENLLASFCGSFERSLPEIGVSHSLLKHKKVPVVALDTQSDLMEGCMF